MLDIDKANIMTEQCIKNYQKFFEQNRKKEPEVLRNNPIEIDRRSLNDPDYSIFTWLKVKARNLLGEELFY